MFHDEVRNLELKIEEIDLDIEHPLEESPGRYSYTARLRASRFNIGNVALTDLSAPITVKDGKYRANPIRLTAFGAVVTGNLTAESGGHSPKFETAFSAENVSLTKLYGQMTGRELLDGEVAVRENFPHGVRKSSAIWMAM